MPYDPKDPYGIGAANLPPGYVPVQHQFGSPGDILGRAMGTETKENQRYEGGLSRLTDQFTESHNVLSKGLDADLLFSQASDSVGARTKQTMNNLRTSLGARGLNPNSGAASGLLSRLMFDNENALHGAKLNAEVEAQKSRQVGATLNFNNALQLANYENSPVPAAVMDAAQNQADRDLADRGLEMQAKSQKKAAKSNLLGAGIGAVGSVLAGLI